MAQTRTEQRRERGDIRTKQASRARRGPRLFDSITEMPRTLTEVSALAMLWGCLLRDAPRGERHPVMVLPGFMGGDDSTRLLRRFLSRLGYKAFPWAQGTNTGNPQQLEDAMFRFYRLQHSLDTKISLIGQSLGGVYAREIAKQFPDAVRMVITLGSPYGVTEGGTTNPLVEALFERMSGGTVSDLRAQVPSMRHDRPLTMPATSVFSKSDGVVHWRTCVEEETAISENIRVWGSHAGMAMNPDVLRIIADRLAQNPDQWSPFQRESFCSRLVYPENRI